MLLKNKTSIRNIIEPKNSPTLLAVDVNPLSDYFPPLRLKSNGIRNMMNSMSK